MKKFLLRSATVGLTLTLIAGLFQIQAGGRLIRKSDIPKAIEKLKSGTPSEKATAAKALGRRGAVRVTDVKGAIEPLMKLVSDEDASVRSASIEALGSIGHAPKKLVPMFLKALKDSKETEVKVASMIALGKMGREARAAIPEIRKIARNKDKKNRKLRGTARNVMKSLSMK